MLFIAGPYIPPLGKDALGLVGKGGLEPPRLAARDPKSRSSTIPTLPPWWAAEDSNLEPAD